MRNNKDTEKKYFFAISIPTRNRSEFLKSGIIEQLSKLAELNIGVYIFDNSDDSLTRNLIEPYLEKFTNIYYLKNKELLCAGENIYQAFLIPKAEYILVIGDGLIVKENYLEEIIKYLKHYNPTCLILNSRVKDIKDKEYNECLEFFKELTWHCTLLGSTIYSSQIINICRDNSIFEKYKYNDFIQLGILLEGILLLENFKILFKYKTVLENSNKKIIKVSCWRHHAFDTFGINWIEFIEKLPNYYNMLKNKVILEHGIKSGLFTFKGFIRLREDGFFSYKDIKEYSFLFPKITTLNKRWIILVSVLPINLTKIFGKIYRKIKEGIKNG